MYRKIIPLFLMLFFWSVSVSGGAGPVSDFYKIMGAFPGAPSDELEGAYRRAKKRLRARAHNSESRERLEELEEAYDTLQDPLLRTEYDSRLKEACFQEEMNLYKVVGVLSDSSLVEITKAYREIRQRLHPDKNQGDKDATRRFQELQEAHRILSHPRLRLGHDRKLRESRGNLLKAPRPEASAEKPAPASVERAEAPKGEAEDRLLKIATHLEQEDRDLWNEWNDQVFQLARELEASGGAENIQEAVSWYRMLAVEGHAPAARRLAPLLEDVDMEEALYRYRQGAADDLEFSRIAVFRQAQIYLTGVYKDGEALIPKDPEKASALFEQAFELGVSRAAVARQYDMIRNYEKALEWRLKKKDGEHGIKEEAQLSGRRKVTQNVEPAPTERRSDTPVHKALLSKYDGYESETSRQTRIVNLLNILKRDIKDMDWNALNSEGRTALSLAAGNWDDGIVRFLINAGADPKIPDANGLFPIHHALLAIPIRVQETNYMSYSYNSYYTHFLIRTVTLLKNTWTIRTDNTTYYENEATPLEMALQEAVNRKGLISDAYSELAREMITAQDLWYLTKEELDRLISKATHAGDKQTLLLLTAQKRRENERTAAPEGKKRDLPPPPKTFLDRFIDFLWKGGGDRDTCRNTFSSAKETAEP